jgi:hypothetical protein
MFTQIARVNKLLRIFGLVRLHGIKATNLAMSNSLQIRHTPPDSELLVFEGSQEVLHM